MECMTEPAVRPRGAPAGGFDLESFRALGFARAEDDAIWTRNWVCVGTSGEIQGVGDLLPYTVGDHAIHVQRRSDGSLVGRFNKAQHGGCRVVPLQCQQGAKTPCSFTSCGHSLDRPAIPAGELGDGTPQMFQYIGLRPERLLPVRIAALGPLLFAHLDPHGPAFDEVGAPVLQVLPQLATLDGACCTVSRLDCEANWKLALQHLVSIGERWVEAPEALFGAPAPGDGVSAWALFPNLVLFERGDSVCAVVLQPVALTRTLCRIVVFGTDEVSNRRWMAHITGRVAEAGQVQADIEGGGIGGQGCEVDARIDRCGRWLESQVFARFALAAADPRQERGVA